MIALGSFVPVYLAFVAKQLVADFFLQSKWMAMGKEGEADWLKPLAAHAAIHALITLVIVLVVQPGFWWLALVDFVIHFVIDRGKGVICRKCGLMPTMPAFWWAIGTDQALHQVTHLVYVILLVTA